MNRKMALRWFSVADYEKEAEYLRSMHQKGWKFVRVSGLGLYRFEECKPEDVIYQLDYNQDGVKNEEEYIQMFEDCGWEYIMNFAGYSYFRKAAADTEGEEGIFCDDESRLEMIKRVFTGKIVPLLLIFAVISYMGISNLMNNGLNSSITIFYLLIILLYLYIFIDTGYHYFKIKNKLK